MDVAKTNVFNNKPDAILISGATAGSNTDANILRRVKEALPETYVFCNTGCKLETVEQILSIADGAVVGTYFKQDGKFDNFTEYERVARFMDKVRSLRK